ncbi:MAG: iron ABC transporter permease [Bacteroidota bacterium]
MKWIFLIIASLTLFAANLAIGSVELSFEDVLVEQKNSIFAIRLEESIIALLAGAALSIGGLFMQTLFRNPLAGPSVLGISSGASLAVAIAMLSMGGISALFLPFYAILGSALFLFVLLAIALRVRQNVTLLIVGLLLGYGVSAGIGLLEVFSPSESLKKYVLWGMGSFFPVAKSTYWMMALLVLPVLCLSFFLLKPLDALLLGEEHAQSLGVNTQKTRLWVIVVTAWLTGVVTAFCGPIAFLGLMVPHLARILFKASAHRILIPGVILMGATLALLANLIAKMPGFIERVPVNIITSILGIPVIIWIILENRKAKIIS